MGNSLRCCLACVLPCGALDVVRIVHLNGLVEEFSCQITAAQILEANPNHVITKPCSASGGAKRIGIVSPESELKRGNIYFLIPSASVPEKKQKKMKKEQKKKHPKPTAKVTSSLDDDNYLRELLSEKRSSHRRRRSVRVAVWRPQLESIKEE